MIEQGLDHGLHHEEVCWALTRQLDQGDEGLQLVLGLVQSAHHWQAFLDFWRLYLIINKSFNFFVIFTTFQNLGCYMKAPLE